MLQLLNWHSLENRRTAAQFVKMYKIANENVAIAEEDRYKPPLTQSGNMHSMSIIIPPCKI